MMDACAWITAIEKYQGIPSLPGIGDWALQIAEILVDKMPPERIVLSLALSGDYEDRLTKLKSLGVTVLGADLRDSKAALARLKQAKILLTYWAGHGTRDPDGRYLLTSESRKDDPSALGTNQLLQHLRQEKFPGFQIGFFHCCAQEMSKPSTLILAPGEKSTQQYFFHAASAGLTASADTEREGFSTVVIAALRESAAFPPTPQFAASLRDRLLKLQLSSRPFLLQWTEGSGEDWSRSGAAKADLDEARRAEISWTLFAHLLRDARKLGVSPSELSHAILEKKMEELLKAQRQAHPGEASVDLLRRAWHEVGLVQRFEQPLRALGLTWEDWLSTATAVRKRDGLTDESDAEDLHALLLEILDQAGLKNRQESFVRLLEVAARRSADARHADLLRNAIRRDEELGPLYVEAVQKLPTPGEPLYLLLELAFDPNKQPVLEAASLSRAWLYEGSITAGPWEPPQPAPLASQMNGAIQQALALHPERELIVELLAPNDLMCPPRELFEVVKKELGTRAWLEAAHPITVRWQNRMADSSGDYNRGNWQQAAHRARATHQAEALNCGWQMSGAGSHIIGLDFPGPTPDEPGRNRAEFFSKLLEGYPFMVWPRRQPESTFQQDAAALIAKHQLKTLPQGVQVSKKAVTPRVLHDLVLFIDEPHRNPYDKSLQSTGQREKP